MGAPSRMSGQRQRQRQQPQQPTPIDWSNPITRGLVFAYFLGASGGFGYGEDGRSMMAYTSTAGYQTGTPIVTPLGFGGKSTNTGYGIISSPNQHSITSGAYSLFLVATAPGNNTIQSAIDDDDGTTRRFQFRLNNNYPEFIPFNSGGNAANFAGATISAASLVSGFSIGATASSTAATLWSNGRKTSVAASGILAPNLAIWIGCRKTGANAWLNGGVSLAAVWNRPLADVEMQSLAVDPWQLFSAYSNAALMSTLAGILGIQRKALYLDSNDMIRQSPGGLNVKPLALINGVLRPQITNETPVVLVNGQLRRLASGETLIL